MVRPPDLIVPPVGDFADAPDAPAVFLVRPREGRPYLARTGVLRRRLKRLSAKWRLNEVADRIECWLTASRIEQALLSYWLAREYFPDDYERVLRLPRPPYVKLILSNVFPRTQITTRLTGSRSLYYGPFASRAVADQFETQLLDLFQIRRCQEDLVTSPDHPGCIYGEMGRCLRPCQQVVTIDEYATEVRRVNEFLTTRGSSLLESTAAARDRASDQLQFEDAARQHAQYEKIEAVIRHSGELVREVSRLHGVAVTRAVAEDCVVLWVVREGCWLTPRLLSLAPDQTTSLDRRLREMFDDLEPPPVRFRAEHLAVLARWFYSSWRDGEWIAIPSWDSVSYRKLVNAVHRVMKGSRPS
jgi:excinuclease UvrABC nuclease subunit